MNNKAFTLIELLIYTVLFSLFSLATFSFCNGVYSFLSQSGSRTARLIKNALALDLICKDIMAASSDVHCWDDKKCVWNKQQLDSLGNPMVSSVGWEIVRNKNNQQLLRRSEGVYNFTTKAWTKRSMSNFASTITSFDIKLIWDKERSSIVRIKLTYVSDNKTYDEIIRLRNRVVL